MTDTPVVSSDDGPRVGLKVGQKAKLKKMIKRKLKGKRKAHMSNDCASVTYVKGKKG